MAGLVSVLAAVLIGMRVRRFLSMGGGMGAVTVGGGGVVGGLIVLPGLVMRSGLGVVLRGLTVVLSGLLMVICGLRGHGHSFNPGDFGFTLKPMPQ